MNRLGTIAFAMLAGVVIGGAAVSGLNAQGKAPEGYAVVDISEITDPKVFEQIGPKAGPSAAAFGGKYVVRTNNITNIDGTPPQRLVVIAFESVEKAKAWSNSPAQKEVFDLNKKSTKSRTFIVEGMPN